MKRSTSAPDRRIARRSGFTLVELLLAGVIAALVLVAVVTTLSQIGRAREVSRSRLMSHLRADAAIESLRRDMASILRDADLFHTRVLLYDGSSTISGGGRLMTVGRDELLIFNGRLEPLGEIDYNGEGGEYETQFRVDEDDYGAALWQRRDPVPDEWPDGGGVATPIAEGIVGIDIMAYDGQDWYEDWDSDIDGLPWGFKIEVTSIGTESGSLDDIDPRTVVVLRTHVSVDRIVPPYVEPETPEEDGALDPANGDDEAEGEAGGVNAPGAGQGGFGGPGRGGPRGGRGGRGGGAGDVRGPGGGRPPSGGGGRPGTGTSGGPRTIIPGTKLNSE